MQLAVRDQRVEPLVLTTEAGTADRTRRRGENIIVEETLGEFCKNGGEGEIRTLEWVLAITRFRVVRLQPLGHLSAEGIWLKGSE